MPVARTSRRRRSRPSARPRGARLLGLGDADTAGVVRMIRAGFPYRRAASFVRASGLPREVVARFAGIPARTLSRRAIQGRLQPDESDRLLRASRVLEMAVDLFEGDMVAARNWLQAPQAALHGESPLDFASTDLGAREVENLIGRLEHGIFA